MKKTIKFLIALAKRSRMCGIKNLGSLKAGRRAVALFLIIALTQLSPFGVTEGSCQDLFYVNGNITITPSATIDIEGGIFTGNSASINNDGIITIKNHSTPGGENWTNNTSNTMLTGSGTVIFNSSEQQNISGNYTTGYAVLEINNSSPAGVILDTNVFVSDTLKLNDGIIHTGNNRITVTAPAAGSITGYFQGPNTPSYIHGNLRRYIAANTDTFAFPVGTDSIYYLIEIENNGLTGIIYIDARFDSLTNHNNIDIIAAESGNDYNSVCDEGVWFLTPDAAPASGSYNLRSYIGNFNNCSLQDNLFAILKRPDNSITAADWDCGNCGIGVGLNLNGGLGRMTADPYALRMGLSNFSQFGIAEITCDTVALPNDMAICAGDSILIYAGDFASYLWSTGSTDSAIYVSVADTYYVNIVDNWDCPDSDTIIVTVNPAYSIPALASFCQGDSVQLPGGSWVTSPGIYYDTLTSITGCDSVIATDLTVLPVASSTIDTSICQGDSLLAGGVYQVLSGIYYDTTSAANGCDSIITTILTVIPPPVIDAIPDSASILLGESVAITANGGITYVWSTGETTVNITVSPAETTTYYVNGTDANGCTAADSVKISVEKECGEVFVPTIFSPDGDGNNDVLMVMNNCIETMQFIIYNRWGQKMFESDDPLQGWDGKFNGKELNPAVFVYYLYTELITGEEEKQKGNITLIR